MLSWVLIFFGQWHESREHRGILKSIYTISSSSCASALAMKGTLLGFLLDPKGGWKVVSRATPPQTHLRSANPSWAIEPKKWWSFIGAEMSFLICYQKWQTDRAMYCSFVVFAMTLILHLGGVTGLKYLSITPPPAFHCYLFPCGNQDATSHPAQGLTYSRHSTDNSLKHKGIKGPSMSIYMNNGRNEMGRLNFLIYIGQIVTNKTFAIFFKKWIPSLEFVIGLFCHLHAKVENKGCK